MRLGRFRSALAAVSSAAISAELVVTEANVQTFYGGFTRLTHQPHRVAPVTAMLCTLNPSPEAVELEKRKTGPHFRALVHLYANPAAIPTFSNSGAAFAVGSVIVKEKLGGKGSQVTGIGGMIKRAPGYDPENGDWEYFYYGKPGEFGSGRIDNCVACHRAAKATDHVYSFSFLKR
jgi:hypothetical protein